MRALGRDSASLEGWTPPRAKLRLARGSHGSAATGPWRRAHSPDRSIKCSDTPRAPESRANPRHAGPLTPPGNHIPALFRRPPALCGHLRHCTTLCGKASVNCDTVPPAPVRPARRTLERGRRNPRKGYRHLPRANAGQHRDIRPMEHVSPVTFGPVRSSPPLCNHPGHCSAIPDVVGTRDDKTPPRPAYRRRPNGKSPHSHPRSRSWAGTRPTMTPDGSKIHQDRHQLHSDVHHTATRN
jgi:hypothetical protein